MQLPIYQVDAFTDTLFSGNPAAVVPLDSWLSDQLMQSIAAENNLAETAFYVENDRDYEIRWFTPTIEVDLCGHATLAAAFVIFTETDYPQQSICFSSRSGPLSVSVDGKQLTLNFPSQPPIPCPMPQAIIQALGLTPIQCLKNQDYVVVLESEEAVKNISPDLSELAKLDLRGVIITALGEEDDFVCRFFAPNAGIDEDAVTGSAYTQLTPFWAQQLNKRTFTARQLSKRSGKLQLNLHDDRVEISGAATLYLKGTITV